MGLQLLFCCEIKKKLRALLFTSFILTLGNAVATWAVFFHLILGASVFFLLLGHLLVIGFSEAGIRRTRTQELKISLTAAHALTFLQVLYTVLLFLIASPGTALQSLLLLTLKGPYHYGKTFDMS